MNKMNIVGRILSYLVPFKKRILFAVIILMIILVCSISIILWEYAISQKHRFEFLSFEYTKVLQNIINKGFLGFCSHTTIFQTEQMSSDFFDVFLRIK